MQTHQPTYSNKPAESVPISKIQTSNQQSTFTTIQLQSAFADPSIPLTPSNIMILQRKIGNSALVQLVKSRSRIMLSEPNNAETMQKSDAKENDDKNLNEVSSQKPQFIVGDSEVPKDGQVPKNEFMFSLRVEVGKVATEVLAQIGQTSENCPYISYWFSYYEGKDDKHLEQAIKKYAPETSGAKNWQECITIVAERVKAGFLQHVTTGSLEAIPEELPKDIHEDRKESDEKTKIEVVQKCSSGEDNQKQKGKPKEIIVNIPKSGVHKSDGVGKYKTIQEFNNKLNAAVNITQFKELLAEVGPVEYYDWKDEDVFVCSLAAGLVRTAFTGSKKYSPVRIDNNEGLDNFVDKMFTDFKKEGDCVLEVSCEAHHISIVKIQENCYFYQSNANLGADNRISIANELGEKDNGNQELGSPVQAETFLKDENNQIGIFGSTFKLVRGGIEYQITQC